MADEFVKLLVIRGSKLRFASRPDRTNGVDRIAPSELQIQPVSSGLYERVKTVTLAPTMKEE
jgi:hypothetical protein